MAAQRNNLAYDISVYEPTPERQQQRKIKVSRAKHEKSISAVKSFMVGMIALTILCAMLYGKVETNRLYSESAKLTKSLSEVQSENSRLQSQIDSKVSLNKIEEYATDRLGLQKLDKSQIQYMNTQKQDVTKVVSSKSDSVFSKIKCWLTDKLEYITGK